MYYLTPACQQAFERDVQGCATFSLNLSLSLYIYIYTYIYIYILFALCIYSFKAHSSPCARRCGTHAFRRGCPLGEGTRISHSTSPNRLSAAMVMYNVICIYIYIYIYIYKHINIYTYIVSRTGDGAGKPNTDSAVVSIRLPSCLAFSNFPNGGLCFLLLHDFLLRESGVRAATNASRCVGVSIYLSISLSLYIYICMYIYIYTYIYTHTHSFGLAGTVETSSG